MRAVVKWVDGVMFLGESDSGHAVVMDGAEQQGGRNIGPRPMELILIGLGGCASFDVVTILQKGRQLPVECYTELEASRADTVPAVFTKIHLHFVVQGNDLSDAVVKRAVELSAQKYCSASIMLGAAGVQITHSYAVS
ncbi:MAG: OsmC family protein [Cellvibrionales bacterium]|nr:OsmC family protein [Porticoccaceae bacterium]|tara:strand:- start:546 stop:959 length:414 start_codon:yes stop_codon:yes gene_type:complete